MRPIHRAWAVCIGCALLFFCTSGLAINAFTVYQPYILAQNGFTNLQSSSVITVRSLFSLLAMLLTGAYYKALPLRAGVVLAGGCTAAGFLLFGLSRGLWGCYAAAAVMGLGYGLGTMIPISIILEHWFLQKRTFAIGLCSAFTGLSTFGIPSLLTHVILRFGLRPAFLGEAVFTAALVGVSGLLIRGAPDPAKGQAPYGERAAAQAGPAASGGSVTLTRANWWVIWPMLLCLGGVTSVGYSHLSVFLTSQGLAPHLAALAITVSGLALTFGKFLFGCLSSKYPAYLRNYAFGALLLGGLLLLCLARGSAALLFPAVCAYGAGLALTTVGITEWAGDWSTAAEYDATVRRFQLGYTGGNLVFSALPGALADRFGGSYVPAYLLFAIFTVFLVCTVQWFYRHKVRQSIPTH